MRKTTAILIVLSLALSGCVSITPNGITPFTQGYDALPIEYKEAVKSGILMAHPELASDNEALDAKARQWVDKHSKALMTAIYGLTQRPEYTQAQNAYYIARFVAGLIRLKRAADNG